MPEGRKREVQMKKLFAGIYAVFAWLFEFNQTLVDHLARLLSAVALVAAGVFAAWYVREVSASRNASGTYSKPYTFTTGTTINSSNVNSQFSDLETEMTDSLSRSGKGGMLTALRGSDGTVS